MTVPRSRTLIVVATEDWFVALHWLPMLRAAVDAGWRVTVATRVERHRDPIAACGVEVVALGMRRTGRDPAGEWAAVRELEALYRMRRPDVVQHVALKPVLYGSIAAQRAGVPCVVNTLPGLGTLYLARGFAGAVRRGIVEAVLRRLMRRPGRAMLVQNEADAETLRTRRVVPADRIHSFGGVGVDLSRYRPRPEPENERPRVILVARMLRDKGVREFVEAARRLRTRGLEVECLLVGDTDPANPGAIDAGQLRAWSDEGAVQWLGPRDDIPDLLASSAIVVLPSYREGMSKSLQEAAAAGRAIVTCDVPGCRDVVRHEWNGLLVPPRDPQALAEAIARLAGDRALRQRLGANGRQRAEREFDDRRQAEAIVACYLRLPGEAMEAA